LKRERGGVEDDLHKTKKKEEIIEKIRRDRNTS
jgi:hypothetical protein